MALAAGAALLTLPSTSHAVCPPAVSPSSGLDSLLASCESWSCDVRYDPSLGYLPENDPVAPWQASYTIDAKVMIADGKLWISGAGDPSYGQTAVYTRSEPLLGDPDTSIYLLQARYRVERSYGSLDPENDVLAVMGMAEPDHMALHPCSDSDLRGWRNMDHSDRLRLA